MAVAAGTTEVADLARLQVYVILYALICLTLGLVVLPGLVSAFTPLSYRKFMLALRTPIIISYRFFTLIPFFFRTFCIFFFYSDNYCTFSIS